MANRFAMNGMPGVISDFQYSMWWNGGMRTTPYFHNQLGILTEVAPATPPPRFYDPAIKPDRLGSSRSQTPTDGTDIFYPDPWEGGTSRFRDAIAYAGTASMGVLRIAADRWLGDRWIDDAGIPIAAGLIVGEALTGMGHAFFEILRGAG